MNERRFNHDADSFKYYLGARTSDNYQKVINKMNTKRDKLLGIVMVYPVAITYLLLVSPLSLANVQIILHR